MHKQASIWDMIDLGNHQWNFENKNKTLTALCSLHQSQITNIAELFRMLWTFRKHEGLHIFGCMPNTCNIRSWTVTLLEHDFALREHEGLCVLTGAAFSVVDGCHAILVCIVPVLHDHVTTHHRRLQLASLCKHRKYYQILD